MRVVFEWAGRAAFKVRQLDKFAPLNGSDCRIRPIWSDLCEIPRIDARRDNGIATRRRAVDSPQSWRVD